MGFFLFFFFFFWSSAFCLFHLSFDVFFFLSCFLFAAFFFISFFFLSLNWFSGGDGGGKAVYFLILSKLITRLELSHQNHVFLPFFKLLSEWRELQIKSIHSNMPISYIPFFLYLYLTLVFSICTAKTLWYIKQERQSIRVFLKILAFKTRIISNCCYVITTVWLHHLYCNETLGEKEARFECFECNHLQTAVVRPVTSKQTVRVKQDILNWRNKNQLRSLKILVV